MLDDYGKTTSFEFLINIFYLYKIIEGFQILFNCQEVKHKKDSEIKRKSLTK